MFTSHKSDAPPQSRPPFVDSLVVGPSSPTSTSESWTAQCFEDYPYGAMHSPEQRHRAYSSKRSSVFNLRARSNTAASTTSSFMSLSPPEMAYPDASRPGTPLTLRSFGAQGETSSSRKSLFRGKKGKRISDSVSSSIVMNEYQEMDTVDKRTSVLRKAKRRNNQPEAVVTHGLRHRISSPFGFQHLTHTDRHQFAAFEQTSGDKLAAGFRVHTTHYSNNDSGGSKADDLHFNNFSSENLDPQEHRSPSGSSFRSPPQSPQRPNEVQQSGTTPQDLELRPALRLTRSVESFSQPGVNLRNHRHSQSVLAPPRLSSLPHLAPIGDVAEDLPQTGRRAPSRSRAKRESGIWDSFSLATAGAEPHLPGIRDDSIYVGHAVTTPDDTAIQAMTPPFSPSLDDVAEEPERFVRPRPAPQPPLRSPTTPKSPNFETSYLNSPRSPVGRVRNRGASHSSPRSFAQRTSGSRPVSQMSDTLGGSDVVRRASIRRPSAPRCQSNTWRELEESWEDDIDYIYEHALEADCDYEWDQASEWDAGKAKQVARNYERRDDYQTGSWGFPQPAAVLQPAFEPSNNSDRDFRASLLVPSPMGVPDLEPTSATSASTMETALVTPSDPFESTSHGVSEGFMLSPSLLVPQEYKEDRDPTYEDLLNEYNDSERHFPLLDPRHSATSSARSRRSSYDSSLVSSAQSSGMWSSPVRRSASSAGSVPELVPSTSRRARRDHSFSLVIDQLADSVASLSHLDEEKEDSDATPPGRVRENRTFFPVEEEPEESAGRRSSIENELRTSLELARRGSQRVERSAHDRHVESSLEMSRNSSQRSTHGQTGHHKQTMSDGAAKSLTITPTLPKDSSSKSRTRAATTSQTVRSPMLSLFPAPPRNSPTPNRM